MTSFFPNSGIFVEIEYFNIPKEGQNAAGDVFLSETFLKGRRIIAALSDGLGSGIKANVMASLTSTMIIKFVLLDIPPKRAAELIVNSLPVRSESALSYATFTLIDIDKNFSVKIIEYDNPPIVVIRDGNIIGLKKQKIPIERKNKKTGPQDENIFISNFSAHSGDRLIFFSDGVTQAGIGISEKFQGGIGITDIKDFIKKTISERADISARDLSQTIVEYACQSDNDHAHDDITCAVAYFRHPRDLLVISGPPFTPENDTELMRIFSDFPGKKIISGGTTAQIIARMLNKQITHAEKNTYSESEYEDEGILRVPAESIMEGVDLVCEGIITLGAVSEILLNPNMNEYDGSAAAKMINIFMNSDRILFLTGTRINEAHQDPTMPVELEIRRNVIKKIASTLEDKYAKYVTIQYI
ncbi:MAG: serine/threonine-protein phosphatase, partial [Treponema sp.]|nr:serine/threonine-protein phosphatase [Treponema sp.]